jgi:glutaconate CoA-transferase subunit A
VSTKVMTEDDVVATFQSGMTIGIGGWGPRRKPMSLVRAILRSPLTDLTVVSYGGADVGLLCAAGKVRRLIYGFVSLDSVPLEPNFQRARESGSVEVVEYDESMLQWGLYAASLRLPFLPTRSGMASDVPRNAPHLRTVRSPYGDETLLAMPALKLDAAIVHLNRADRYGNAQFLGDDLYFDDLFCLAADRAYLSCERIVATEELGEHPVTTQRIHRWMVHGVVEAPNGAHFTSCLPDYPRDEEFQLDYVRAAKDPQSWAEFEARYLRGSEAEYQQAVAARAAERKGRDV